MSAVRYCAVYGTDGGKDLSYARFQCRVPDVPCALALTVGAARPIVIGNIDYTTVEGVAGGTRVPGD